MLAKTCHDDGNSEAEKERPVIKPPKTTFVSTPKSKIKRFHEDEIQVRKLIKKKIAEKLEAKERNKT